MPIPHSIILPFTFVFKCLFKLNVITVWRLRAALTALSVALSITIPFSSTESIKTPIILSPKNCLVTPPFLRTHSTAILINDRYIFTILLAWLFSVRYVDLRISINKIAATMEYVLLLSCNWSIVGGRSVST